MVVRPGFRGKSGLSLCQNRGEPQSNCWNPLCSRFDQQFTLVKPLCWCQHKNVIFFCKGWNSNLSLLCLSGKEPPGYAIFDLFFINLNYFLYSIRKMLKFSIVVTWTKQCIKWCSVCMPLDQVHFYAIRILYLMINYVKLFWILFFNIYLNNSLVWPQSRSNHRLNWIGPSIRSTFGPSLKTITLYTWFQTLFFTDFMQLYH